jgi:hypothetical protein
MPRVVTEASTVPEALSLIESPSRRILVSDIGMPGTDGYELIGRSGRRPHEDKLPAMRHRLRTRRKTVFTCCRCGYQLTSPSRSIGGTGCHDRFPVATHPLNSTHGSSSISISSPVARTFQRWEALTSIERDRFIDALADMLCTYDASRPKLRVWRKNDGIAQIRLINVSCACSAIARQVGRMLCGAPKPSHLFKTIEAR